METRKPHYQPWSGGLPAPFQDVHLFYIPGIGSHSPDYRIQVRNHLQKQLTQQGFTSTESLSRLEQIPSHPTLSLSISHTHKASLVGWTPLPFSLGVDIETRQRLTPALIKRVSSTAEVQAAPDSNLLWSAKESTFKSLRHRCQTISEISIIKWQQQTAHLWSFEAQISQSGENIDGIGRICIEIEHILAFFVCHH